MPAGSYSDKNNRALLSNGAKIAFSTSSDPRHPAEMILDGDPKTYWTTTGMFPQSFIIQFAQPVTPNRINISALNVANWHVDYCKDDKMQSFEGIVSHAVDDPESKSTMIKVPSSVTYPISFMRFTITKAHQPFCAVKSIVIHEGGGRNSIVE